MFGQVFDTKIRAVVPRLKDEDDQIRRYCELSLQFDFEDNIAAGLGDVGKSELKYLRSGDKKSGTILLDAINLVADFEADKKHKLELKGVKAIASKPSKEEAGPTLKAILVFPTRQDDLMFFVNHLDETVKVKMDKIQTELEF